MFSKEVNFSAQKTCKVNLSRCNILTTDLKLNKMSIMSLHKQLKYKCLFVYRTLNNIKVPEYISNMYIMPSFTLFQLKELSA